MAYSIRVREMLAQRAAEKRLEAEHHATFLNRARTAQYLGISIDKLRRMITAGTLPAPIKGEHRQSPPRWHIDHLREFKARMQGG
jgi:predicted DNA-binding transcriptional regulator AlpA